MRDGDVERDMQYVRQPYFANNVRTFYRPVEMKGQRRLDKEDATSVINELEWTEYATEFFMTPQLLFSDEYAVIAD